jgi:ribonuclease III
MSATLEDLQNLVGHTFQDLKILERAVTHRSWAYENMAGTGDEEMRLVQNESMEFVGDSVLGLAIAEQLYKTHPKASEGDLTLMKHHLVSTQTLAGIAERLDLGAFVRFGTGEEKTGGRKKQAILANTLEAIIAAVFLDAGYEQARAFVVRLLDDEIIQTTPLNSTDFKTTLQEFLQARKLTAPTYSVTRTDGPPHSRTFHVEAVWATGNASGIGNSIKAAEMMAASEALTRLKENEEADKRSA